MPILNKTFVDKLPYTESGKQAIYFDGGGKESLPGFGIRVTANFKTYIAQTRVDGKVKRVVIGRHGVLTLEEAKHEARKILGHMAAGKDPIAVKYEKRVKVMTLGELYQSYRESKLLRPNTARLHDGLMRLCFSDWQNKAITDITKDMIEKKHKAISEAKNRFGEGKKTQANQAMRLLRCLFNYAEHTCLDASGNPLLKENPVKRLSERKLWNKNIRRQSVIDNYQLPAWYKEVMKLPDTTRDLLLLCLFTGLRRNEAAALEWSEVNLANRTLTISAERAKNGYEHRLPLSTFVLTLLTKRMAMREEDNKFVFPGSGKSGHFTEPKRAIKQIAKNAGITFMSHDLRRTFITVAESLDISYYALKKLINHRTDSDVTAGYIVTEVQRLREPMEMISQRLIELIEAEPSSGQVIEIVKGISKVTSIS